MDQGFADRRAAGRELGQRLGRYADRGEVVVLGLPRGGVPVAYEVALALHAPLDVFVVRKLGVPGHEELAMGAIASGGVRVLNPDVLEMIGVGSAVVEAVTAHELRELERRERYYRGNGHAIDVAGRTTIVVDDGLATGATMRAAVAALRRLRAETIVVAVPTASPDTCAELAAVVDEIVCARTPEPFMAVGFWYLDFAATTDEEVRELLAQAARAHGTPAAQGG